MLNLMLMLSNTLRDILRYRQRRKLWDTNKYMHTLRRRLTLRRRHTPRSGLRYMLRLRCMLKLCCMLSYIMYMMYIPIFGHRKRRNIIRSSGQ